MRPLVLRVFFLPVQIRDFSLKPANHLNIEGGEMMLFYLFHRDKGTCIPTGSVDAVPVARVPCFISLSLYPCSEKSSQGELGYSSPPRWKP